MLLAGVVAIVAWGTLAFGAVYPWAYTPLLIACAVIGLYGVLSAWKRPWRERAVLVVLLLVISAAGVQLVPLGASLLKAISPSTHAFLVNQNLSYALDPTSHPLSIDPSATLRGLSLLAAFSLFFFGLLRALTAETARRVAVALISLGVLLAIIGITQKALLGDHAYMGMKIYGVWEPESKLTTPFGPFVNKNHFAGWMLMVLPLAVSLALGATELGLGRARGLRSSLLWLSSPNGGRFQLLLFAAAMMAAALLMTGSRSGLAALVFVLVAAAFAASRRFESKGVRWAVLGSAVTLFAVVFAWAGADVAARVGRGASAVELRKRIWSDSLTAVRDFPVAGTGLNTFGTAMLQYQSSNRDVHYQEAHNEYLQVLVEGGVLLAVPAVASLFVIGATIRRRFSERRDDVMGHWLRVGAVIGLAAVGLQSIVEFSLQMPGNAAVFAVVLALAMHRPGPGHRTPVERRG